MNCSNVSEMKKPLRILCIQASAHHLNSRSLKVLLLCEWSMRQHSVQKKDAEFRRLAMRYMSDKAAALLCRQDDQRDAWAGRGELEFVTFGGNVGLLVDRLVGQLPALGG